MFYSLLSASTINKPTHKRSHFAEDANIYEQQQQSGTANIAKVDSILHEYIYIHIYIYFVATFASETSTILIYIQLKSV